MSLGRVRCRRGAHGGVSVLMAVLLSVVALAALLSIDVGHVFYRQRQLQAVADMSALAAAQQLRRADSSQALHDRAVAAGQAAAGQNGYGLPARARCKDDPEGGDGMAICVGVWNPRDPAAASAPRHFRGDYDRATLAPNAVQVTVTRTVPILFGIPGGKGRQLRAEAIATASPPVAAFSVGSALLEFDSARSLLGLLLGNTVQLSVMDWQGLLDARVTLEQLRLRAGAGSVDDLLHTTLSLSDFYSLVLRAADRGSLLNGLIAGMPARVDQAALAAGLSVGKVVDLRTQAPTASSAADVGLSVAQLLTTAAQVANAGSAIDLSAAVPLLPGSRLVADIGDPPRMAVGPVHRSGDGAAGWATTASTAQASLGLYLPLALPEPVSLLGQTFDVKLELPLRVEAARAQSSLTALRCAAKRDHRRATLATTTQLASVCLADRTKLGQCATDTVAIGRLEGAGLVQLALTAQPQRIERAFDGAVSTLAPGATASVASRGQLTALLQDMAANLDIDLRGTVLGLPVHLPLKLGTLTGPLATVLGAVLNPALESLLRLLGLQLGAADVWVHDVDCDNTNLVY